MERVEEIESENSMFNKRLKFAKSNIDEINSFALYLLVFYGVDF